MKLPNQPLLLQLAGVATILSSSDLTAEARTHGGTLLSSGTRQYQYNRRSPLAQHFDLVSDIFSMPLYMNSFRKQQRDGELAQLTSSTPRYSVSENDETGVVELAMELPGVLAKDLTVELVDEQVVRVYGSRKYVHNGHTVEAEFDQSFQMNEDVDPQQLKVTLQAGILKLEVPKKQKTVRRIPIEMTTVEEVDAAEPEGESIPVVEAKAADAEGDLTITDEEG